MNTQFYSYSILLFQFPIATNQDNLVCYKYYDGVHLDTPSLDLLNRLLCVDPNLRLRSLRTLQTIAFYKGYNFEDVKLKKVHIFLFFFNDYLQNLIIYFTD